MPFKNITQPKLIIIEDSLRLRKPGINDYEIAVQWYQNPKVMYYSEGAADKIYNIENVIWMHNYLNSIGELYYIETYEESEWKAIGDVTLSEENTSITIGSENNWGKGIGKKVINTLLNRARKIELEKITISIFKYNERSKGLFKSLGFIKIAEDDTEDIYELIL